MKITVPKEKLTTFKNVVDALIKMSTAEVKFILKPEGIRIKALTPDKAAAVDFLLKPNIFKDYNVEKEEEHIISIYDFTSKKFKAFKKDLEIDFDNLLTMTSGKVKFTLPTYNEEDLQTFNMPEVIGDTHFNVTSEEFTNMIDIFEEVNSNPIVMLDTTPDSIMFSAKDYDRVTSCDFGIDKKENDELGTESCAFSHNILKNTRQKITKDGTYYISSSRPMFYVSEDDDVKLIYLVAPRERD